MKKLSEQKYLSLNVKFRNSKSKFLDAIREALTNWLKENNNFIPVPPNYREDFNFFIEGGNEQFDAIRYSEKDKEIYLRREDSNFDYCWAFAEEDMYIVDAVMNLYFKKPPMFKDEDEVEESEYLESGTDTRTGEIFDDYYGK